ncbi:hypothetical protein LD85_1478 [Saccharolobus islandicus L.D.8.5]|uniref:Uncharacterized protein n=1 Tax=Saccharolobus islandicus (strain L.D.8.5 / Lassen \|nr:hypothetical protein LD85_1478 [Sulfolobus islandicus L.D.8.5]
MKKKERKEELDLDEVETPYTVTNRAISEMVSPKDTMLYLDKNQIGLILTAYEFARLPEYFGEKPVTELAEYADKLKHYLVSKGGRGRRDILRILKYGNSETRENVNKSIFRQLLGKHDEGEVDDA